MKKFILIIILNLLVFSTANSICFAVISDPHLEISNTLNPDTSRRISLSKTILENAINMINNDEDIEFTIISGDLLNTPRPWNLDASHQILEDLEKPYFVVLGNNDFSMANSGIGISKTTFTQTFAEAQPNFSDNIWSKEFDDFLIIGVDNINPISGGVIYTKKMMLKLDSILSENINKQKIFVVHYPLTELNYFADGKIINNQIKLLEKLKYNNVSLIISGHYHYAELQTFGKLKHLIVPALVEFPHGYLKITLDNDNFEIKQCTVLNRYTQDESLKKTNDRVKQIMRLNSNSSYDFILDKLSGKRTFKK
jgi:3',5'-cyclic AMP phosphodiesterase CpdA